MSSTPEKIIGIDLGTTNSAAALYEGGRPTVIPSAEGPTAAGKMFPSVVAFTSDDQLLVGEPAKRQMVANPDGTILEIKRKMGTDYKVRVYGKVGGLGPIPGRDYAVLPRIVSCAHFLIPFGILLSVVYLDKLSAG